MTMQAHWSRYRLHFTFIARTSRETLTYRDTWYLRLTHSDATVTYGECGLFRGLSRDDTPGFETRLSQLCHAINTGQPTPSLDDVPAIKMGYESALAFKSSSASTSAYIPINGLIWMGDRREMLNRINQKLDQGFNCLKLKIGGIDFDDEISLLHYIRRHHPQQRLTIRLDANGAFQPHQALEKLKHLSDYHIHSIEQPIRAGQREQMAQICQLSPIPIALDEELIHTTDPHTLLSQVKPAYIILKPTLCGALSGADAWVEAARANGVGWWATSALESNVGLISIATWVAKKIQTHPQLKNFPQGLGTGALYSNNIPSSLSLDGQILHLAHNPELKLPLNLIWNDGSKHKQ